MAIQNISRLVLLLHPIYHTSPAKLPESIFGLSLTGLPMAVVAPAKLELPTSDLPMFLKQGHSGYNVSKVLHPDVELLSWVKRKPG